MGPRVQLCRLIFTVMRLEVICGYVCLAIKKANVMAILLCCPELFESFPEEYYCMNPTFLQMF